MTIATLALTALTLVIKQFFLTEDHIISLWQALQVILYFYVVGAWAGYMMLKSQKKEGRAWVNSFIAASAIKLLLYFAFLIISLINYREHPIDLVIVFGACYIVFAAVERTFLIKDLKTTK